jgi:colanic acid biosynthesis glycosyl transferase WcaI
MLADLAFHLASRGMDVHVVTSRSTQAGSALRECVRGVTIHRVSSTPNAPHGLLRRAAAYGNYYLRARKAATTQILAGDVVILKTYPPLLSVGIAPIALRKGAKVVNWIQDLFPEVAERHGMPGTGGLLGTILRNARDRSLCSADRVVVIGERMATYLKERTEIEAPRLVVIHNWADGQMIAPVAPSANTLREKWALKDTFVVGYSGNLGRVHEFDTLLGAAKILKAESGICFLFVGRGPRLKEVMQRVRDARLVNVRFEPHQSRDSLSQSLGVADVHVSTLFPRFEGLVHPSKLYGSMAAGRPTIFVGDVTGETAKILAEADAGISIPTGDAKGLAAAILKLRDDPLERKRLGANARKAFEEQYDMPIALAKWESILGL